ncbi:MAG: metallophosphoesterase [Planctomycetota bacterium]|jgi:3',5'-cyclic AMP phosphodiesterase CpdA
MLHALLLLPALGHPAPGVPPQSEFHWIFDEPHQSALFAANRETPAVWGPERGLARPLPAPIDGVRVPGQHFSKQATDTLWLGRKASEVPELCPPEALTVSCWASVEEPTRWGGLVGTIQDNGGYEKGWLLGYDESVFTFALSTEGADDGDGVLTYLPAALPFERGTWHHVVATYDGAQMRLYLDGEVCAISDAQSGPIKYDGTAPFVMGAYLDADEAYYHDGRLWEVQLADRAWSDAEVAAAFASEAQRTELPPYDDTVLDWRVAPYLTWPTLDGVSVLAETTLDTAAILEVWEPESSPEEAVERQVSSGMALHEFVVRGLQPNSKYFYRVRAQRVGGTAEASTGPGADPLWLDSPTLSFRTAATPDRPFTFSVIGDTQAQPEVVQRVSNLAYEQRPNFVLHAGDLVSTGSNKRDWTDHFFPHSRPLIERAPLCPVLGNHEQDADHYYRYMSLPEPEHRYSFVYGNAEFFMIDGNRELDPGGEQLAWLEEALAASRATWKFAVLHQPPYTSDSDDYGDTYADASFRGDRNARQIVELLEKYGVDLCFSGHVHDYERTFPIRGGRVVSHFAGGVIYVTAAGGGGHLEDFDPANTWFGHRKANRHHVVQVGIHGAELELFAMDEEGRLFDSLTLTARSAKQAPKPPAGQGPRNPGTDR